MHRDRRARETKSIGERLGALELILHSRDTRRIYSQSRQEQKHEMLHQRISTLLSDECFRLVLT